jgi:signal transduction histidine kinase/CheY-like chemotaxis protein
MISAALPVDEPSRLQTLRQLEVLDTDADPVLDGLVACAAQLTGCPVALVSMVDAERQSFLARHGLDARQTPRDISFCAHAILGPSLFVVADARHDARFADNPLVTGEPRVAFYAGVPLRVDGLALGTLCVVDRVPRTLDEAQRGALEALGRAAEHWLASRRLQAELAEKEALLAKLTAEVPGMVYRYRVSPGGEASLPYASEHAREMFELSPAELALSADAAYERVHEEDRAALRESLRVSAERLAPWRHEFRVCLPRQGLRWREGLARPERQPDGSVLWHGITTDVTERKESEARLRQVRHRWQVAVDAARLGLIEFDLQGGCVLLDAAARAQHGLPAEAAAGADPGITSLTYADWLRRFRLDERRAIGTALQRAQRDGAAVALTVQLAAAGEPARHLEITARRDTSARGGCLVGACRDVSEREQLEQLRRDKLAAEQAAADKSRFLSRVSHELRTPLNAILGFTQLLQLDALHPLHERQRERVEQIRHAGRHLLGLINDVLDLTRHEQGGWPMAMGRVDVQAQLSAACAMVETLAQRRGVRLELPAAGPPLCVRADARALKQVLVNLLSNGIKYNRPHGRLGIALRHHGERLEIAVSDEGQGLDAAQRGRLFEPFNRLGAEDTGIEGSGLGLVIAKSLAEAMGGELRVQSTQGAGSTFGLWLPLWAEPAGAHGAGSEPARREPVAVPPAPAWTDGDREARILYIEDEPVNALLVVEALRGMPHWKVMTASDGEQGLELARTLRPDLLLIDINLPRMSGSEVVRALRRRPSTRDLPCIALSADALPEQIAAAREAGFDDYWTKPLDLRTLVSRLGERLARREPAMAD